ncbi:hypothetical protein IQ07DRAFT_582573 [Pyrenochaeta sp. DS3sAY3a]|nr:hypothetical protein IQ07DRAFT_582573 [Pyrenochaeta sp. DS3sAY3a]
MDTDSNTAAVAEEGQKSPLELAKKRHGDLSSDELIWLDLLEETESEVSAAGQARVPSRPLLGSIGNDLIPDLQAWAKMYEDDDLLSIFGTEMTAMAAYLNRQFQERALGNLDNNPLSTVLHEEYPHTLGVEVDKIFNFFFREVGDLNARVFKKSVYRKIRVDVLTHGLEKIMMNVMRRWNSDHNDETFDSVQFTTFKDAINYLVAHKMDDVQIEGYENSLFEKLKDKLRRIKEKIKQSPDWKSSRGVGTDWRSKANQWLFS